MGPFNTATTFFCPFKKLGYDSQIHTKRNDLCRALIYPTQEGRKQEPDHFFPIKTQTPPKLNLHHFCIL
jgi:hypothetical protein